MLLLQFVEISLHQLIIGLFWVLLHSLWQGLIAAAFAFILLHLFKQATAQVRYGILASCLLLFIIGVACTFLLEINQTSSSAFSVTSTSNNTTIDIGTHSLISDSSKLNMYAIAENMANKYGYYLVLFWFICYLFYFIRFISGLIYISRLSSDNMPVDKSWSSNLERLKYALRINRSVRIFHSERIHVPVIIGAFKPIILIPIAVANQLPLAEVEAILLHELAHIKRNDFLVNLIQTVIDQLFFFNPAVLWMSSRLREEREKCCDDIVLMHSLERDAYINALVRFQESMVTKPVFEMALSDNKFQLFKRIRRIINKDKSKSTFMDKTIFFFSIVSIATLGFMSGDLAKQNVSNISNVKVSATNKPLNLKHNQFITDTVPDKKETIEQENHKREIKQKIDQEIREQIEKSRRDAEVREQKMLEQKIQLEHQMNDLKLMNNEQKLALKMHLLEEKKMMSDRLLAQKMELEQAHMQLKNQAFQKDLQMKIEALSKDREHMNLDKQKELDGKLMQLKRELQERNMEMQSKMAYLQNETRHEIDEKMQMQREHMEQMKMELERNREASFGHTGNSEAEEIISVLLASKIIDKTDPLSFKLNSRELVVNDKKQTGDVFTKLRERFIHSSGDYIEYSHNGGSTSTSIHRD